MDLIVMGNVVVDRHQPGFPEQFRKRVESA
jgi:hypothetical protein